MKNSKLFRLIAALLTLILVISSVTMFAACKKDDEDDDDDKTSVVTPTDPATTGDPSASTPVPFTPPAGDEDIILGTWKCDFDITDMIKAAFAEQDESFAGLDISGIMIKLDFKFDEDGTYSISADKTDVKIAFDKMFDQISPALIDMLKKEIAAATGVDPESITDEMLNTALTAAGIGSVDEFIDMLRGTLDVESFVTGINTKGKYELKDHKIYLEHFMGDSNWFPYELSEHVLILSQGENELDPEAEKLFPLQFYRVA